MTGFLLAALTVLISYLIGAIPFGYLIARWRGVDIFQAGSGNVGATNVGRVLGWRLGILVFVLDFAKGALPTGAASIAGGQWLPVLAGLSAVVGHLFPIFLRFHGGKGVATGAGVVAVLLDNWVLSCFALLAVGLVVARHHANIKRLLHGNENRFPESQLMSQIPKIIHVLAVGLWFGSSVFFLITALVIFNHFESLGASAHRPSWIPVPSDFDKEMGTRLAGVAVAPLFDWYFPLQIICGFLAIMTGLTFSQAEPGRRVHRRRNLILLFATAAAVIGWLVADYVGELRLERYSPNEIVAESAKAAFAAWHGISLTLNMVAIGLVTVAMALVGHLPPTLVKKEPGQVEAPRSQGDYE